MNRLDFEKVELLVPKEWKVNNNNLLNLEPEDINDCSDEAWNKLSQDIFNAIDDSKDILIDLGWYPEFDPEGHFGLVVIEENQWQRPIETFVSRSTKDVKNKINELLKKYSK